MPSSLTLKLTCVLLYFSNVSWYCLWLPYFITYSRTSTTFFSHLLIFYLLEWTRYRVQSEWISKKRQSTCSHSSGILFFLNSAWLITEVKKLNQYCAFYTCTVFKPVSTQVSEELRKIYEKAANLSGTRITSLLRLLINTTSEVINHGTDYALWCLFHLLC